MVGGSLVVVVVVVVVFGDGRGSVVQLPTYL